MTIFPTRILLATDGSEYAKLAATPTVGLGRVSDSELRLVTVGEAYPSHDASRPLAGWSRQLALEVLDKRPKWIGSLGGGTSDQNCLGIGAAAEGGAGTVCLITTDDGADSGRAHAGMWTRWMAAALPNAESRAVASTKLRPPTPTSDATDYSRGTSPTPCWLRPARDGAAPERSDGRSAMWWVRHRPRILREPQALLHRKPEYRWNRSPRERP